MLYRSKNKKEKLFEIISFHFYDQISLMSKKELLGIKYLAIASYDQLLACGKVFILILIKVLQKNEENYKCLKNIFSFVE